MKILVADDDRDLVDLIRYGLYREGHTVVTSFDGESTLRVFQLEQPDLVILDLVMAPTGGMEVLDHIRKSTDVPILILSALRDEDHIVSALYKGADDYMVKPFGPRELRARIKALLRRTAAQSQKSRNGAKPLVYGKIMLDRQTREVVVAGLEVKLSRIEFELLNYLMLNHNIVLSYHDLLAAVWGYDGEQNNEVVRVTISRLRKRLDVAPGVSSYIVSIPGVGYKFQVDDRDCP
ncbi:MAG: response regulator transcription factor [Anaerolineae bacterium]|nr:response regulator transcription factor [Anaerolineae bacterium]